jgi:hypothetical protein
MAVPDYEDLTLQPVLGAWAASGARLVAEGAVAAPSPVAAPPAPPALAQASGTEEMLQQLERLGQLRPRVC